MIRPLLLAASAAAALLPAGAAQAQQLPVDTLLPRRVAVAMVPADTGIVTLPGRFICINPVIRITTSSFLLTTFTTIQPVLTRVAGVQVTPYSGAPGAGAVVRIRGAASLDSNVQPLYVVDGVPVFQYKFNTYDQLPTFTALPGNPDASTNPLLSIAPEDVERVEVLKGAFETGQYGFLGQNGVIRITTRRGPAAPALRVEYTGRGGVQTARTRYPLLGAREAAELANEAATNNGNPPEYTPAEIAGFGAGTNWQAELLRTSAMQAHHLGLRGGTAHGTRYYVGLDYLGQRGIVLSSDLNRYTLRLNLDQDLGRKLHLSGGLSYGQTQERRPDPAALRLALRYLPTVPVWAANGDYATDYGNANPVQLARQNQSTTRNRRLLAHAELRYELLTGLTLELRAALERDSLLAQDYQGPSNYFAPIDGFETGVRRAFHQQITLNPALRYARTLADRHALSASVEASSWRNQQAQSFVQRSVPQPPFNLPPGRNMGSVYATRYNLLGYQVAAGYTYDQRYAVQGSLRADTSPLVPADQARQWLPAAQATWHAAQESWLPGRALISTLDLWAGAGQTSNRGNYAGDHGFTYRGGYSYFAFLDELTTQADAGLYLRLWQDRVSLTATAYRRDTRASLGSFGPPQQLAYVRNRGLELTLSSRWRRGHLSSTTSLTAAFNRNRYERPADAATPDFVPGLADFILTPNQPMSSFRGVRYLGPDGNGKPTFATDGGGVPIYEVLGSGLPRQLLGLGQELTLGRFTLQLQLDAMLGYQVFDPNLLLLDVPAGGFNATTRVRDRWTPTNPGTDVPRAGTSTYAFYNAASSYSLQSGNHLRLSSAALAVEAWRQNARTVSVFLNGTNLFVLTNYRGFDPNVSSAGADARQAGLDQGAYPVARSLELGVRAAF